MKHGWYTTVLLLMLFTLAQFVGITIVVGYLQPGAEYLIDPPQIENENLSFIPIMLAILIGTGLVLLIAKFKLNKVWSVWFFLSIWISLSIALYPFLVNRVAPWLFLLGSAILAFGKIRWKNSVYQNIVEMFIYGGIVALFLPIINFFSATVLLLLMSLYDVYAVFKSKHMVTLAKFQMDQKLFAGLSVPSKKPQLTKKKRTKKVKSGSSVAVLGGGDIAFPLLYCTGLLKLGWHVAPVLLVSLGAAAGLLLLFVLAKPEKFYPALPFVSGGALVASGLIWLISLL